MPEKKTIKSKKHKQIKAYLEYNQAKISTFNKMQYNPFTCSQLFIVIRYIKNKNK